MKKASKAIAFAMASAMAVSMAACGGSASSTASGAASGDSASATGNGSYDQITYAYATFNNIPTEEDLDVVEEEINKITREKIGAEITLKPISIADYVNKVSLSLQGGEKIDVYQSLGNFGKRKPDCFAVKQYKKYKLASGVVSLKRLLNQSNLKSWSSKMIKKSLEAYFFTLKNKIVFCKKQFQNMSVFCFVSTEIV